MHELMIVNTLCCSINLAFLKQVQNALGTLTVIVYRIPSLHHSGLLQFCTHVSTLPMIDPKMKKTLPTLGGPPAQIDFDT